MLKKKISRKEIEKRITPAIMDDLMVDWNIFDTSKIKVVVNGIHINNDKKMFIKPKEISKVKPLYKGWLGVVRRIGKGKDLASTLKDASIYYLVFRK